jgi:Tol biopolymer transport system component
MGEDKAQVSPNTEGARGPFFSPNGRSIGFISGWNLKRINLSEGTPITLAVMPPVTRGASWGVDDTIIITTDPNDGLTRYTASGELIGDATKIKQGLGLSHRWPEFLPDGRTVLYTRDTGERLDEAQIEVVSLDTGKSKPLIKNATCARYARSGHIVFARSGNLWAVPFDIDTLTVTGDPELVIENVLQEQEGVAHFDIADNGTLTYISGGLQKPLRKLVWFDRSGNIEPLPLTPGQYGLTSLSPDNRRVAIDIKTRANSEIWMYSLDGLGNLLKMTDHPNEDFGALWHPDGKRIVFASEMNQTSPQLHFLPSDKSKEPEMLVWQENTLWVDAPGSFSKDGNHLALTSMNLASMLDLDSWTDCDIRIASLANSKWSIASFAVSRFKEHSPAFSPDNRWIAYVSNETGVEQIHVKRFPGAGGEKIISVNGGTDPIFNPNGRELFYRNGDRLMVQTVDTSGEDFSVLGHPEELFEVHSWHGEANDWIGRTYAVSDNGQRFLIVQSQNDSLVTSLTIVTNWFEELKEKVPLD